MKKVRHPAYDIRLRYRWAPETIRDYHFIFTAVTDIADRL
jgi:hypothetical protein